MDATSPLTARALLLGERLDMRGLERTGATLPGVVSLADGGDGLAFGFRWGALVTIGMSAEATAALQDRLLPRIGDPVQPPAEETATLQLDPAREGTDKDGVVLLSDFAPARLAVVAEALARSALLSHQEAMLVRTLDRLDPVLARLRRGRLAPSSSVMLASIGEAIAARSRAGARVDTAAKPDLLWDLPALGTLYATLADEWEIEERTEALSRKLEMIREISETLLSLVEARRSRGLELAVVLLIALELGTAVYGLFK
ncbi:RMD1 family protein [Falsiroseomonas sp. HW251]|uniref:RMD1 family protein n=1 Tax=Falsiroseomonas sp. HW251 TaxID=3390998 RepID=UPI003D31EF08